MSQLGVVPCLQGESTTRKERSCESSSRERLGRWDGTSFPGLVAAGHEVTATTRTPGKVAQLRAAGVEPVVVDGLDREAVIAAVLAAGPEVIVHQMTALADLRSLRNVDKVFAATNELRTRGTDNLLAAAARAGTRRVIAQSKGRRPEGVPDYGGDAAGNQLPALRAVVNPGKLGHIGPVSDLARLRVEDRDPRRPAMHRGGARPSAGLRIVGSRMVVQVDTAASVEAPPVSPLCCPRSLLSRSSQLPRPPCPSWTAVTLNCLSSLTVTWVPSGLRTCAS